MNQVIRGKTLSLTGVRDHPSLGWAAGEFSFESSTFFPIDNQEANEDPDPFYNQTYTKFTQVGFGNEGKEHNYHFCTEIHTVHYIMLYVVDHATHYIMFICHGTIITARSYCMITGFCVLRFRAIWNKRRR